MSKDYFDTLHMNLKMQREDAGLTQKELAEKSSVSKQAISNYERDRIPTLENLVAIAKALHVSIDWLLGNLPESAKSFPEDLSDVYDLILTVEACLHADIKIQKKEEQSSDKVSYDIVFPDCPQVLCDALAARNKIWDIPADEDTQQEIYLDWESGIKKRLKNYEIHFESRFGHDEE